MVAHNQNMANQAIDIAGSDNLVTDKDLNDESSGLGQPFLNGTGATLTSISASIITITGLSGLTDIVVGNFITISGASDSSNNGTFPIVEFISSLSLKYSNAAGSIPDAGSITWIIRKPYSLEDDLNFERTDRQAIKGVSYSAPIPSYNRPSDTASSVPANLANIAGKTTDARGFIINRNFYGVNVNTGDTFVSVTSTGNLKHSDSSDKTGVTCFDASPFTSNFKACYVEIFSSSDNSELTVQAGIHQGEKIFGVTRVGSSSSPDSIEVLFYSCPHGNNINTSSSLYTWESSLTNNVGMIYGYFLRLDQIEDETLRFSTIQNVGPSSGGSGPSTSQNFLNTFLFMGA